MENLMKINEFKNVCNYLLSNNTTLEDKGNTPIAIGIEGSAGIGKTSVIEQIAKEREMTLCKINLSQLEEIGDLTGLPIKEYEIENLDNGNELSWITEIEAKNLNVHKRLTGKCRMSYAPPAWLPSSENPNGTIVLFDDFSRANNLFMQAIMEIVNTGKYISWSLPKHTTIMLSSNPDDGNYQVSSLDDAQKTRFINFTVSADMKDWALWAEKNGIDDKSINFAMVNWNEIFLPQNNVYIANQRSYVTFCKAISSIKDWSSSENLGFILQIAKGCFMNDTDNVIGRLFVQFIKNNMHKLITSEEIINLPWEKAQSRIKEFIYKNGEFRPELSSIMTTRLSNYILSIYENKNKGMEDKIEKRLVEIIDSEEVLMTEDLLFYLIKTLISKYPAKTGNLIKNEKIRNKIIN